MRHDPACCGKMTLRNMGRHRIPCNLKTVFTWRRCASVGAMALCLCLSESVTGRGSLETAEQIELVLAWDLPSTYPTRCYKEIRVSP